MHHRSSTKLFSLQLFVFALACSLLSANASSETISVNFHANDADALAEHQLSAGETAGFIVVDGAYWNNIDVGGPGASNTAGAIFAPTALTDDTGNTSAASLGQSVDSSWFVGYAASAASNSEELNLTGTNQDDLFNSYLALNGPSGDGSPPDAAVLTITNLGAPYTTNGYDLYVYSDSDRRNITNNSARRSEFTVTAGGASLTALVEDDDAAAAVNVFDGTFVLSDNDDTGADYSNYTVFSGLTADFFTLEVTSGDNGRGAISGFQIVAKTDPLPPGNDPPNTPAGPNVVLFVVDDMGWADWERRSDFYETPNMTRLANRGIEFTNGYASASICSPTRASLLTGLSPATHGITKWIPGNPNNNLTNPDEPLSDFNLDSDFYTLGEAMHTANYHTAHIGKWHLGQPGNSAANPINYGFETNVGGNDRGAPSSYTSRSSYFANLPNLDSTIVENYLTDHLAVEAKNYIESRVAANQKFFLNFDLYAVHTPIQGHPDYLSFFQGKTDGVVHSNAAYASMLRAMDDALGTILDTLDTQGVSDDTVIIFTSDHGGLTSPRVTSNAPLRGGKGQQWEGGHRVPLIIAGAGVDASLVGTTTDFHTISHDLYPTILGLTGVAGDATHNAIVEGISLQNVLNGSNAGDRDDVLFWHFPHESNHNGGPYGAVIDGNYKFIENYATGEQLLFDLASDLGETNNLASSESDLALDMRQALHDYLRQTDTHLWSGSFQLLPPAPVIILGDANGSGEVNNLDIAAFALALFNRPAYQSMYPTLNPDEALDMSGDGVFNNLDIAGFAAALGF